MTWHKLGEIAAGLVDSFAIEIVHEGLGGELERRVVQTADEISPAIASMGPFAPGDNIRIRRVRT